MSPKDMLDTSTKIHNNVLQIKTIIFNWSEKMYIHWKRQTLNVFQGNTWHIYQNSMFYKLIQTPERRMDNNADSSDWLDNCSFYLKNSHNENSCMAITKTEQISLVRTKSDISKKILCENNHDNAL